MLPIPLIAALAVPVYQQAQAPIEQRVKDLVRRMTVEEKARQLDMYAGTEFVDKKLDNTHTAPDAHVLPEALEKALGNVGVGSIHDIYPTAAISNEIQKWVVEHSRLHIPALFIEEGVHGYNGFGETVYPCSINLASTFDLDLAKQTGAQIGAEARSNGVDMILGPVLDVAREPRWGRIEEDFGEDPDLTGAMGAAYIEGMQGETLASDHSCIAEPKHFAGHGSPESGNNTNPVHAGEREFRTIFLRSFEPAVREGHARGIMAAYHEVDGVPCAGNPWLLTEVLRKEWGFQGFVLSDLGAIWELYGRHHVAATEADAARLAISSGVDMQFYDFKHDVFQNALIDGIKTGKLSKAALDQAVSRVLRVKFELGLFDHPYVDESLHARVSRSAEHLATSLRSSRESIVLLKNDKAVLPLSKDLKTIAVIGPNAAVPRMGDYTPSQGVHGISMMDGIEAIVPAGSIRFDQGESIPSAVAIAKGADVVIMGLGEREGISGEGSDRSDLNLPGNQEALLEAVYAVNPNVVLVLQNGRPLTIPWAAEHIPAIVEAWYPGEFGGQAIAETLFGINNPSGKLPISFPRSVGTLPDYYNHDVSKQFRYVDGTGASIFPFGHGLSYTTFAYSNLKASGPQRSNAATPVSVSVDVQNTGKVAGEEVVQLYLRPDTSSVETPARALKAFRRMHLEPGQKETVTFPLGKYELEIWSARKNWEVEAGTYKIWVGGSSAAELRTQIEVPAMP